MTTKPKRFSKMYMFKTVIVLLSFLLIISVVKSEDVIVCNDDFIDMNNIPIINVTKYCDNIPCVIKCCGLGEVLNSTGRCVNATEYDYAFQNFTSQFDYSNITINSWDGSGLKPSQKKLAQDFVFVRNKKYEIPFCSMGFLEDIFYILEDGLLKINNTPSTPWYDMQPLEYCVDYVINPEIKLQQFIFKEPVDMKQQSDRKIKSQFLAIGLLTSCFFLLLVLVVYCLLPQLRNIAGMILMGYVSSLFFGFFSKAILDIITTSITAKSCKILSPIVYYAVLSKFFWLIIMSFDLWWTFRGTRRRCDIHRQGELVKFIWYSLYAWGAPLVLTIPAVIVDNMDLPESTSIIKPPFSSCLADRLPLLYYMHIPTAILCSVNITLFVMTAYNIWIIKYALKNSKNSQSNKKEENRFILYIKLGVLMGVSWCTELIPNPQLWVFFVVNSYNVFIGVTIFFLFVFKKSILISLCKRFGINNNFVQNLESRHSRSESKRSTKISSTLRRSRSEAAESTC